MILGSVSGYREFCRRGAHESVERFSRYARGASGQIFALVNRPKCQIVGKVAGPIELECHARALRSPNSAAGAR